MQWEPKPDSQAAIDDQAQHDAFIRKCAEELAANKPPPRAVAPIRSGITQRQLDKKVSGLLKKMGEIVGKELRVLRERVAALEATPISYAGVYEEGKSYPPRTFVSHGGSMWWTPVSTKARPGEGRDFVLVVKRGRDGRDGTR